MMYSYFRKAAEAHPASSPRCTWAFSLGVKRPGRKTDHSPPSSAEVKDVWSYTPLPHTPSWLGAQLKAQGQLYLLDTKRVFVSVALIVLFWILIAEIRNVRWHTNLLFIKITRNKWMHYAYVRCKMFQTKVLHLNWGLYFMSDKRVYPKVSGLAAWSENCKWYSSLPLGAVVSLFCESV
jgi:hypothetical protein